MHDASAAFRNALADETVDLALPRLVTITTRDGLVHRWTDAGAALSDGIATYLPLGLSREALRRISYPTDGSGAAQTTAIVPLGANGLDATDVTIGRYDAASVVVQVLHAGATATIFSGFMTGGFQIDDRKRATVTIEGMIALLEGSETHVIQAQCPAAFGENRWPHRCPFPIEQWRRAGTVTEVLAAAQVRVALTGAAGDPPGQYIFGTLKFGSGALRYFEPPPTVVGQSAGASPGEVVLTFGWNLGLLPAVGDTVTVSPGCARTFARCAELAALVDDPDVFDTRDYQGMLWLTGVDLALSGGA